MKIKELRNVFSELMTELSIGFKQNPNNITEFSGLKNFRTAISKLETTKLLTNETNNIRKSAIFITNNDTTTLNSAEGNNLKLQTDNLIKLVKSLNDTFEKLGGEINDNSVSIKLPEVTDFDDLSRFSSDFHKVLNQSIVNEQINGQVRIDSVENGSIWLDVYLGSAAAVTLIGGLAWASAVVFKKIQEGRLFEKHVQSLGIKNESIKEIQLKQKEALDLMIDAEANNLYNDNFEGDNNEQIERLKLSIKMFSNLIDKGAEIHPALNQPESVKNLYPEMSNLKSLESKIKKIAE
jgi:hypothetical protein